VRGESSGIGSLAKARRTRGDGTRERVDPD
jgi:hypothetical protein